MNRQPDAQCCGTPLLNMPCGSRFMVEDVSGAPAVRSKLCALGILPGTEIEVCRHGKGAGAVCVRVRQSSLVLGENLARSIYCRAIGAQEGHAQCRNRHCRAYGQ